MSAPKAGPTPGPWKWCWRQEDGEANCGVFAEPSPGHAYSVCRAPSYATQEEWDANARLIAASPDSHAANVMFVAAIRDLYYITPFHEDDEDYIYDMLPSSQLAAAYFAARAAIAKAVQP